MPAAEAVAAEIAEEFGVETLAVAANVAIEEEANALIAAAAEANGRVDVLVNNAGITRDGLAARMSDDDFDAVIDINLKGTFHCCRAAAKLMMKQRWGRIVNMSSVVGVYGNAGQVNYAASKAGVIGLTKSLARELARRNITANAVAPGFIATDMTDALSDAQREAIVSRIGSGRLGEPDDIAHLVRFLASDEASYITGQVICVDGGVSPMRREHRESIRASAAPTAPIASSSSGVGAVTAIGVGVEALWEALMGRECCIAPIERFDTSEYEVHIAGEVRDFDGVEHGLTKKEARRFERFVQYAIVAADEALAQSGLEVTDENRDRIAVVFGTGIGGIDELQKSFATLEEKGPKRVNPLFIPTMIGNIAAGNLAIRYGMRGECLNVVTACATGAHCIGTALRDIRHGYIDAALVGGTEESVSPICIAGFTNLSALTRAEDPKEASLPFDARRGGFVAGEGAGALVIESLESALARGAEPIAEITGFGSTGDAYHMTAPDPEATAITAAMAAALAEGGFTPADLGHLNAHGTGTPANDATESKALANLMGGAEAAAELPVTSIKGTTGHMLGAAGAVEAIVCALSVARDAVPPTAGFAEAAEDCPVAVVTEAVTDYPQKVALSTSLGFGGHNAALAFSPYKG